MSIGFKFFTGEVLDCPVCGNEFEQKSQGHSYCSKSCAAHARNLKRRIKWEFLNYEHAGFSLKWKNDLTFNIQLPYTRYFDFPDIMTIESWLPEFNKEVGWLTRQVTIDAVFEEHFQEAASFMKEAGLKAWSDCTWGCAEVFWQNFLELSGLDPLTRHCDSCGKNWANLDVCFESNDFKVEGQPDVVCSNCIASIIPF